MDGISPINPPEKIKQYRQLVRAAAQQLATARPRPDGDNVPAVGHNETGGLIELPPFGLYPPYLVQIVESHRLRPSMEDSTGESWVAKYCAEHDLKLLRTQALPRSRYGAFWATPKAALSVAESVGNPSAGGIESESEPAPPEYPDDPTPPDPSENGPAFVSGNDVERLDKAGHGANGPLAVRQLQEQTLRPFVEVGPSPEHVAQIANTLSLDAEQLYSAIEIAVAFITVSRPNPAMLLDTSSAGNYYNVESTGVGAWGSPSFGRVGDSNKQAHDRNSIVWTADHEGFYLSTPDPMSLYARLGIDDVIPPEFRDAFGDVFTHRFEKCAAEASSNVTVPESGARLFVPRPAWDRRATAYQHNGLLTPTQARVKVLHDEYGYSSEQVGERLGLARSYWPDNYHLRRKVDIALSDAAERIGEVAPLSENHPIKQGFDRLGMLPLMIDE